jgi:hypothetical protein
MPSLSDTTNDRFVKAMVIGDSGAGKTGSLASLAKAGYNLRILDMDGGIDPLRHLLADDPAALSRVSYQSFRDRYKTTAQGTEVIRPARAYIDATKTLDSWPDDDSVPAEWGSDHVYVVDSLTLLSRAAFNQAISIEPGAKDPRRWYGTAQGAISSFLSVITSPAFATNVIVLTHINQIELENGSWKGYPSTIGNALSRTIALYFNNLLVVETKGFGSKARRIIRTIPDGRTDAKAANPKIEPELSIETGLADFFSATLS